MFESQKDKDQLDLNWCSIFCSTQARVAITNTHHGWLTRVGYLPKVKTFGVADDLFFVQPPTVAFMPYHPALARWVKMLKGPQLWPARRFETELKFLWFFF